MNYYKGARLMRPERLVRDGLGYRVISAGHLTDEMVAS